MNKKKAKKGGQTKAADAGLDDFVDWTDPIASESAEEREDDMSHPICPPKQMEGRETILGHFTCFFRHWWSLVL